MRKKNVITYSALFIIIATALIYIFVRDNKVEAPFFTSNQDGAGSSKPLNDHENSSSSTNNLRGVKPVITSVHQGRNTVEVKSKIPDTVEADGVCTLTISRGSAQAVSVSQKATPNKSDTSCGGIKINKSKLTTGIWRVEIEYLSSKSTGLSDLSQVKVD